MGGGEPIDASPAKERLPVGLIINAPMSYAGSAQRINPYLPDELVADADRDRAIDGSRLPRLRLR